MKIYAVESGCYSDRQVKGIFSTRKLAQEYIDKCNASEVCWDKNDFNPIQEWTLDEALSEREYTRYQCGVMLDTGEVKEVYEQVYWGVPESRHYVSENVPALGGRGIARAESHRSAKHAMKVATEARQEYLRTTAGAGGTKR